MSSFFCPTSVLPAYACCGNKRHGDVTTCTNCKHVAYRVEVVCKTCTPRPEVASQPAQKKVRRYFNTKWQISRPWLQYANGLMSCLACKEYPQTGVQQTWLTGNAQLRELTVREHSNCGVHCTSLALWESGGASTTVIGGLPEPVRNAIAGLFQLVYRIAQQPSRAQQEITATIQSPSGNNSNHPEHARN